LIEFNRLGKNSNRANNANVVTKSRYTKKRRGLIVRHAMLTTELGRISKVTRCLRAICDAKDLGFQPSVLQKNSTYKALQAEPLRRTRALSFPTSVLFAAAIDVQKDAISSLTLYHPVIIIIHDDGRNTKTHHVGLVVRDSNSMFRNLLPTARCTWYLAQLRRF
jgi:hypothetical protein